MSEPSYEVLKRIGTWLLPIVRKKAAEFLRDTPVEVAANETENQFHLQDIEIGPALTRWCATDGFQDLVEELIGGQRELTDDAVTASFIKETGFHLPDSAETQEKAKEIIDAFLKHLERNLYLSPTGLAVFAERQETISADHTERLERIETQVTRIHAPAQLALPPTDQKEEEVPPGEEEIVARVNVARTLLRKGKPRSGLSVLEGVVADIEGKTVSDLTRYRIEGNLGACGLATGDQRAANRHFQRALRFAPEKTQALANAAQGELAVGSPDKALPLARRAHESDPKDPYAAAVLISALQQTGELSELDDFVKEKDWLVAESDTATALGLAYLAQGRYSEATALLREAAESNDFPSGLIHLAVALVGPVQEDLKKERPLVWRLPEDAVRDLREAEASLTKAINLLADREEEELLRDALASRAAVRGLLGDHKASLEDCERVLAQDPDNELAVRNLGLGLQGDDPVRAAELLERALTASKDPEVALALARAYGESKRYEEAVTLLLPYWDQSEGSERISVGAVLLHAYHRLGDDQGVQRIRTDLESEENPEAQVVIAEQLVREAHLDEAIALLRQALTNASGSTRDEVAVTLAEVAYRAEDFASASESYRTVIDDTSPLFLRQRFAVSLFNSGQHQEGLEFATRQRGSGDAVPIISEVEARIRQRIGDLSRAKTLFLELAATESEKSVAHSVQAAVIALQDERLDEARAILAPLDEDAIGQDPQLLMQLAHARMAVREGAVIDPAYRARRLGYNDPDLHLAYLGVILRRERFDNGIVEEPPLVEVGTSVHLRRGDQLQVVTIEDDHPELARGEVSPSDELGQRLLGRSVGDLVPLRGPPENLEYEITKIQSKYVYAFQESISKFPTLFPDHDELLAIETAGDDVSKILAMIDVRSKHVEGVLNLYRDRPLPLATVAQLVGRSLLDVWQGLRLSTEQGMRVSTGSTDELGRETDVAQGAERVVIDLTGLLVLHELDLNSAFVKKYDEVFVPQAVVDQIVTRIRELESLPPNGVMGKEGEKYVFEDVTPTGLAAEHDRLRQLLDFVHSETEVVPAEGLLELPEGQLEKLDELIGRGALTAVVVAQDRAASLFSDDLGLRLLAREEWGVEGFWSQPLLKALWDAGVITEDDYHSALVRLAGWRWSYVFPDADDLWSLIESKDFRVDNEVAAILRFCLGPDYSEEFAVQLAAGFLREVWLRLGFPQTKNVLLTVVLGALSHGRRSPTLIPRLRVALHARLNLALPVLADILRSIDIWAATQPWNQE